jgi:hypothetical protein
MREKELKQRALQEKVAVSVIRCTVYNYIDTKIKNKNIWCPLFSESLVLHFIEIKTCGHNMLQER